MKQERGLLMAALSYGRAAEDFMNSKFPGSNATLETATKLRHAALEYAEALGYRLPPLADRPLDVGHCHSIRGGICAVCGPYGAMEGPAK